MATAVTMPLEIAVLAALAGIAIVGVGGGLVRPMQTRWERWLKGAERESSNIRATWQESRTARPYPTEAGDAYHSAIDGETEQYATVHGRVEHS